MTRLIASSLLVISLHSVLLAQITDDRIALKTYLELLEETQNISFTYVDETIVNKYVIPPRDSLSLAEILNYLESETNLSYHVLDNRFITISQKSEKITGVCGFLYDEIDGKPIERASINYADRFTVSDSTGYFEIEIGESGLPLIIRRTGYLKGEILNLSDEEDECLNIILTPEILQLNEVTVMKLLTSGISKEPGGEFLVNVENLGILPGLIEPDVLQAIQALPGIQSINETVSDINVRGGTNDQNLVLWDGIKMYQTGHFFGLISAFNPYMHKDVRIIKNGSSAFYGDGVSSTIDIRSDDGLTQKFTGGAGINMINIDAFVKIPVTPKLTLQLAARRAITDLIKTPIFTNYFERIFRNTDVTQYTTASGDTTFNSDENFYFYDISGNLSWDISKKDHIRVHVLNLFNDLNYQENIVVGNTTDSKTSSLNQISFASGISYKRNWNQDLITNIELFLSSYLLNAVNFNIPNNQQLIQENEVLDTGIKLDALWRINNRWDFLGGYQFFETGIGNLEEINIPEYKRYIKQVIRSHAVFAEANLTLSNKTNLRFGVRGNYYGKFNMALIEPRIAIQQSIGRFIKLELLGEFKNQTATQVIDLQNDFLGVEKRRWVLSNEDDIPIIQSKQLSAGIYYQRSGLLISVEGFYKYVSDITSASQGFQNQYQFERTTGDYEVIGGEFLINQQFENLSIWAGYSYSTNMYHFPTLIPPEFPNNLDIKHTTSFGISWKIASFETSAGLNWHSGKPYTVASGVLNDEIEYGKPNNERLPNYLRIDLSLRYNFNISKGVRGQIGGSIWNITNHRNVFNIYYLLDETNTINKIEQIALGFTPNLSLRVKF